MNKNEQLIQTIKEKNGIVGVIGEYGITLKKEGKNHKGLCPFHNDKNPSLVVYPETQSWYCFAEKKGGDVFSFVMQKENCSFQEALKKLADKSGITLPNNIQELDAAIKKKRVTQEILSQIVAYYNVYLLKNKEVCDYFIKERGLSLDILKKYEIGYAPPKLHGKLLRYLSAKGFAKEDIVDTGMIYNNGREYLAGHIVFPYMSDGKVVYITGRGYPTKSHKKPFADKLPQQHLFFEDALKSKEVIIAEGEIDTYTLQQADFNACGIPGVTGFKKEWVQKFCNVENIYIALDGDEAGQSAALKLGELLKDKAKIVTFPTFQTSDKRIIKDWNELFTDKHKMDIKSFKEDVQTLIEHAKPLMEFKIEFELKEINPDEMYRIVSEKIIPEILVYNEIETDHYVDLIVKYSEGNIRKTSLKKEIENRRKNLLKSDKHQMEILDDNYSEISPSQGFIDNIGYFFIPARIKGGTNKARIYQVVSSRKELFICTREELEKRHIELKTKPTFYERRWSMKHISEFIEKKDYVSPSDTFNTVKNIYQRYVDFGSSYAAEVMALYTFGTYVYSIFESYPYIFFTGEMGSGKSKTLSIAQKLCFNAIYVSNITPATLFRVIDGSSGTFLLDEAERLRNTAYGQELLCLLNNGYKRGPGVPRINTDTFEVECFNFYSPKMIANITGLDRVTENRCIKFTMLKTSNLEKANKIVSERSENWGKIRHYLYCFGLTSFAQIQRHYFLEIDSKEKKLSARDGELWFPILAIAKFLENNGCHDLHNRIFQVAKEMSSEARLGAVTEWLENLIYAVAKIVLIKKETSNISIKDIKSGMEEYMEENIDCSIKLPSNHWVGKKLRNLGLVGSSKESSYRIRGGYRYNIKPENVQAVLEKYGLEENFNQMHDPQSRNTTDNVSS